ncbi:MAG: 3-isopropylmalate dehydrogenase [Gammaproteobacteria bacterium]|nr:3-isopropylmalate dehydrogenase [Gammaproteobacteria bacterium]
MPSRVLLLPGDGIGPEILAEAVKVIKMLRRSHGLNVTLEEGLVGGIAIDEMGDPLPGETLALARGADAILLGAVGGPKWDSLDMPMRPEKGLLRLRSELGLFANLRPAVLYPELEAASPLKPEVVAGLDILIVRELTGGIYFGEPRGIKILENGEREGFNTLVYRESEIERIARTAFRIAMTRKRQVCSVDKANVLESTALWREVVGRIAQDFPDVQLTHMYVDNAAMQLVRRPKQFDVIVTTNLFGDILSDLAAMLSGSIGMLPSASIDHQGKGMYEPIHGSAPELTGRNVANPLATILSVALMLRYSLSELQLARRVEEAVHNVLRKGMRTLDIHTPGMRKVSTHEMGDAVVAAVG